MPWQPFYEVQWILDVLCYIKAFFYLFMYDTLQSTTTKHEIYFTEVLTFPCGSSNVTLENASDFFPSTHVPRVLSAKVHCHANLFAFQILLSEMYLNFLRN